MRASGDHRGSIAAAGAERAEALARVPPMRDRRRHLVGFSVAALLLLAAAPALPAARRACRRRAQPRLAEPEAVHRAAAAADRNARPADRRPRPQPQRLHRPAGAEIARPARATSASTGWPRASTLPSLDRRRRRRRPQLRRAGAGSRRTRARGREREARLARAEERRPPGRGQRQDRHLPLPDRRRTVRLRRARPRPGDARSTGSRAACTATWSSTTTTAPSSSPGRRRSRTSQVTLAHEYNHILQFGYDAFQDAWFAESTATWMEDQVYNGIDDYLRYVRRWVKRWDTPLTASSIKEYGSAVWNQWLARRYGARDRAPGLGAGDPRAARAASRSPPTTRRSAPPAAPTSATTSPASPPPSPSGARARGSARAGASRTCRDRGALPARRPGR